MIKFERKFLYCFADIAAAKELIGKEGLFFDDYLSDKDLVTLELKSLVDVLLPYDFEARGFVFENNVDRYKFFYCDPNLESKRAYYLEGKKIQRLGANGEWFTLAGEPFWDDGGEYRIKPETKEETFLTYKEVAEWLIKGNGQWIEDLGRVNLIHPSLCYNDTCENDSFPHLIRKWNDTEWHEATKEYISEVTE